MKRYITLGIALLLCLSMVACGKTPEETVSTTQPAETVLQEEDPVLTARREQVVEKMRSMQTVYWQLEEPLTYSKYNWSTGTENDAPDQVTTLQPGRIYQGIPYTHASGSEEAFLDFAVSQDAQGVYTIAGLESNDLTGHDGRSIFFPRVGNDCADAVFWAWGTVSGSIDFTMTYYMTEAHGCLPVGQYKTDYEELIDSKALCEENGAPVLFEAYSQLRPGDAVVKGPDDGHAMMVSEVCVVRNEDGTVDGMNSYIKVVHQTSSNLFKAKTKYDETLKTNVYYCGGVDDTRYFYKLFAGGYLPVTCKELVDPAPIADAVAEMTNKTPSLETLYEGTITANYRISLARITVTDAAGEKVQEVTCYGREAEMYELVLDRITWETEKDSLKGGLDMEALASGEYTVTYTCGLATGEIMTVGSFTFTK